MDKPVIQSVSISRQKKALIFLVICLAIILIYLNSRLLPIERYWTTRNDLPLAKLYHTHHRMKEKVILYWNTFFGVRDMYFGVGSNIFENCSVRNCYATYNKSFMSIEHFDAIIFHGPRYTVYADGYPIRRSVFQKYIFYSLESPYNIEFDDITKKQFYNWTMTYRRDSDIHTPYGLIQKSKTNYEMPSLDELKNKTKKVAWFVSNCHTEGSQRRMKYATELSKWISVDIYGDCGKFSCKNYTYCYEMLGREYKFYLSFENSICKDYVTEKMFNILHYNVVPIVLGFFDYSDIAPPNSIINTIDFKNPKDLAEHLLMLDQNGTEYLKYFEWKRSYVVKDSIQYTLCQLCQALNSPTEYSSYEDIEDWFYGFKCVL